MAQEIIPTSVNHMALPTNLTTNEVKNHSAAEVEFSRYSSGPRELVFQQSGELPHLPHRLSIRHTETGASSNRRRRSVVRFDIASLSAVDTVTPVVTSAYIVVDAPVGHLTADTEILRCLAELGSFCFTAGDTTFVHAGTACPGGLALRAGSF